MIDYRQLYIDFLNETVTYEDRHGRGTVTNKSRVRFPKQYEMIETTPLNKCVDLTTISDKSKVFVWSDQHFGHKNIIKYSNRPYADTDEMREAMIRNHNAVVSPDDFVIWGGDVTMSNNPEQANQILHRLNGYKILVVGNHDMHKKKLKKFHVDEVHLIYTIEIGGATLVFTHFPMENLPRPVVNVHGHTHDTEEQSVQHINICVEHTNYTPVPLSNIVVEAQSRTLKMITG